jgi:T-complex protein 1 subunit beta
MKAKVEKIKAHGVNCFVNRQLIYNWPEQLFADAGIMSIEHADFDGIERLALVTGGEIASTFDHPELVKLGACDLIEEVIIGEDKVLQLSMLLRTVDKILGCCCWRGLHDCVAWCHTSTPRRSRAVVT